MFNHTLIPIAASCFMTMLAGTAGAQLVVEENPDPNPALCNEGSFEHCLDGVGAVATSLDSLRIAGERISSTARAVSDDDDTGAAAGEGMVAGWSLWSSLARSDYESSVTATPYDGDTYSLLFGAGRNFGEQFIGGLAVGYEDANNNTFYNAGTQDRDGFIIAPYGLFLINNNLSLDASGGYASLNTDETRLDPTNGARLSGSYDADRYFATINLNAIYAVGDVVIGGRLGVLYAKESQDAYNEVGGPSAQAVADRDVDLTQGYIGLDIGYSVGAFEPYGVVMFRRDLSRDFGDNAGGPTGGPGPGPGPGGPGPGPGAGVTRSNDRNEWMLGLGLRFFGDGVSGSVEWTTTQGRDHFDDDTVMGTLSFAL